MLCIYDNLNKNIISLLKKTKKNYDLSSKIIAQKIGATEAVVSRWLTGKAKPNSKSCEKIVQLFHETWESGIIELPPCSHWPINYYLRVEDLRNPFDTWYDGNFTGEDSENFLYLIEEWKRENQFKIIKHYKDYKEFKMLSALEEQNYNTITKFLYNLPAQQFISLIQDGRLNTSAFDYQLLDEALRAQNERR